MCIWCAVMHHGAAARPFSLSPVCQPWGWELMVDEVMGDEGQPSI